MINLVGPELVPGFIFTLLLLNYKCNFFLRIRYQFCGTINAILHAHTRVSRRIEYKWALTVIGSF